MAGEPVSAARQWVAAQRVILSCPVTVREAWEWKRKSEAALTKLKKVNDALYENVMKAYGHALNRARRLNDTKEKTT